MLVRKLVGLGFSGFPLSHKRLLFSWETACSKVRAGREPKDVEENEGYRRRAQRNRTWDTTREKQDAGVAESNESRPQMEAKKEEGSRKCRKRREENSKKKKREAMFF